MKINTNTPITSNYPNLYRNNHTKKQTNFCGNMKANVRPHRLRKSFMPIIMGLMMIGGLAKCTMGERYSGQDNINGYNVEYYNIKPETKDFVLECWNEFTSKLNENNNFLKDTKLIITKKCSSIKNDDSFTKYIKSSYILNNAEGMSFYSDNKLPRRILIQEDAQTHMDVMYNYTQTGVKSKKPLYRQALIHEIGHQFDEYFGHDHNEKFAQKFDSVLYQKEINPYENPYGYKFSSEKEKDIVDFYHANNSLSDKNKFKEAYYKDLINIIKIKKTNPDSLPLDLDYYTSGIDFNSEITPSDVDESNLGRCETYANLFSYALGENDGDRQDFINAFPNSYKIVTEDIEKYLGKNFINTK